MNYTETEKEVIGLCVSLEAAGDMANHALLEMRRVEQCPDEAEVYFKTHIHQQLFLIRLLDFVSENSNGQLTGHKGSCLSLLKQASKSRKFDIEGSVKSLSKAVEELEAWLNYKRRIKLWLPTLDLKAEIEVSRLDFLFIAANHSKHNLSRLSGVTSRIKNLLSKNGYSVDVEHIPLALDDFQEHLNGNYFIYYGTLLCELINNLIWGVHLYLHPQYLKSYVFTNEVSFLRYEYVYPDDVVSQVPRQWFWRLMNNVRSNPYIERFRGAHYLKEQSSLELYE
ncbi:MAG: hypothetical protein JXQ77_05375 [Campylobacterales bacterium]|nr:hypothetical protein [Campylobacterales bacterium]